ncbi:MAG: hypothetical protein R3Y59_08540 [bacterium]
MGNIKQSELKEIILFILLILFNRVIISIGGELSISSIFIMLTSFVWIRRIDFRNRIIKNILHLYIFLFISQVFAEFFSDTTMIDKVKGVAITVSSAFTFFYFFYRFVRNPSLVKFFFLGTALSYIIMPNRLSEIEGSEFGYYKFTLIPILSNLLLFATLQFRGAIFKRYWPHLIALVGGIFIMTGARSSGLTIFIIGAVTYIISRHRSITAKSIYKVGATLVILLYAVYALLYVPAVMNGSLDSVGNSAQLKEVENPYNPINLLMQGRTDSFVPFIAFMDKPLTGYGYGAEDPSMKYTKLLYTLKGADEPIDGFDLRGKIPAHSVVGAYAASYGICALLALLWLLGYVFNLGVKMLLDKGIYIYVTAYFIFNIIWNVPFSPAAHFKTSIPIVLSFLTALYVFKINKRIIDEKQNLLYHNR